MLLLSPAGLLLVLAAVLPPAALVLATRRAAAVRERLGLPAPGRPFPVAHAAALVAGAALLGVAAAQPALVSAEERRVRTDAEAFVVLDVSRSMLAAPANGPTRLARAKAAAVEIAAGLDEIPVGVATVTDRVLPNLFPTADRTTLERTIRSAVAAELPPPRETAVRATTFAALGEAAGADLFPPRARRRLLIVLTDGESRPYGEAAVARQLRAARVGVVLVHVWRDDERLERAYRPDAASTGVLADLAAATQGTLVSEGETGRAAAAARDALGAGPTAALAGQETIRPLAPWVALAALAPLGFAIRRRNRG